MLHPLAQQALKELQQAPMRWWNCGQIPCLQDVDLKTMNFCLEQLAHEGLIELNKPPFMNPHHSAYIATIKITSKGFLYNIT